MTDRTITYRIRGDIRDLQAKMLAGGKAISGVADTMTAADAKSAKFRKGLSSVGDLAGKIGLGAAAGLGVAIAASARFDKAMSGVEAATHASASSMETLRAAALQAGQDTAFSATEAADGIEQLAKAGVSTGDILKGGLNGALDLAAAGTMEVGDAAEVAATAMTQFKLAGDQVPHVADLLAAAAGKAQGEVSDFGYALKQGGLVAAQTGLSIEETTGALGAFASAGLLGSDAGTSMKTMFQSLTPSSEKAEIAIESLGISAYDQQGRFIGLEKWAGRLREGLKGMSDEQRNATLKTVFGSDAVRAASIIYENGAKGVGKWISKVDDAGFAAETAAIKTDNLAGDWERLTGSIETALIGVGDSSQGPLRSLIQRLDGAVNKFNEMPDVAKSTTAALLGITAVTGGTAWFGVKVIKGVSDARDALENLSITGERANGALGKIGRGATALGGLAVFAHGVSNANEAIGTLETTAGAAAAGFAVGGPWGAAIGGAIGLTVGLGKSQHEAAVGVEDLTSTLDQQTGAITKNSSAYVAQRLEADGVLEAAQSLGLSLGDVTQAALGNESALARVNVALSNAKRGFFDAQGRTLVGRTTLDAYAESSGKVTGAIGDTSAALKDAKGSISRVATAQGDLAGATGAVVGAMETATVLTKAQAAALAKARKEARGTAESFVGLGDSVSDTKVSLNQWIADMAKGARALRNFRENSVQAARRGLREGLIDALQDAGQEGALRMEQLARATDRQIKAANRSWQAGQREVGRYVDKFTDIPPGVAKARGSIEGFVTGTNRALDRINDEQVNITLSGQAKKAADGMGFASGGAVFGAGTATSDSIDAKLSNGEHVLTAKEVRAFGGHQIVELWRKAALKHALPDPRDLPRFAAGGAVGLKVRESSLASSVASISAMFDAIGDRISDRLSKKAAKLLTQVGGALGTGGTLTAAQISRGQQFARSQVGKPYVWGGAGPGGYDCSGFQSAVLNAARGRYPYSRLGSTGSMPWAGSRPGPGRYTMGWFVGSPGHTSGNIGGLNVESAGGVGVRVGSAARSPRDPLFNRMMHFAGGGPVDPALARQARVGQQYQTQPQRMSVSFNDVNLHGSVRTPAGIVDVRGIARAEARKVVRDYRQHDKTMSGMHS